MQAGMNSPDISRPCWTFVAQFQVCLYMFIDLSILQPGRLLWQHQNIDRAGTLWLRVRDGVTQQRTALLVYSSFFLKNSNRHLISVVYIKRVEQKQHSSPVLSAQQQTIYSLLNSVPLRSVSAPSVCRPSFRFMTELNWGQVQN